ncbi:4900_t:CDS:2 [Funneliformis geosporum]|uniref:4900_t:CDS:1 n=1 Tax=Funneliformis geosporum TaxID=1117311 RepID=A0A9W4SM76_9GLOM|nr:4900_t:CDS:2 [Funneliformis geosporum]
MTQVNLSIIPVVGETYETCEIDEIDKTDKTDEAGEIKRNRDQQPMRYLLDQKCDSSATGMEKIDTSLKAPFHERKYLEQGKDVDRVNV